MTPTMPASNRSVAYLATAPLVVKMPAALWEEVFDEGVTEGSPAAMEAFTRGIIVLEGNIDVLLRLQDPNMFRRD